MLNNLLEKISAGEDNIPGYRYHISPTTITLQDGRIMAVMRLKGIPFEVVSNNLLDNNCDALNTLFLSLCKSTSGRVSFWAHLDHYETSYETDYKFPHKWINDFNSQYMRKFKDTATLENNFYITTILKPSSNDDDINDSMKELNEIQATLIQTLLEYDPTELKKYTYSGNEFSEVYEFIAYLYNGFWERVPITSQPMAQCVQSSYLHAHYQSLETRFPDGDARFSQLYDLKDFPASTKKGQTNEILTLPFPFLLTFSFAPIGITEMKNIISSETNKKISTGDQAENQFEEMEIADGELSAGNIMFGDMHGVLMVHGQTQKQAQERGGIARTIMLGNCGTTYSIANASLPDTFFSIMPGNLKARPRLHIKTTRNFICMFPMNTYSSGKQYGNPLGDGTAVMPLKTTVRGVYHLNLHYSLPGTHVIGEKIPGHTMIHGATGTGKTTLQTTILAYLTRFSNKVFAIDKDGSMRGFIEATGGVYFKLENGVKTGLNPMQLPETANNKEYLQDLLLALGRNEDNLPTAEDMKDIKLAVDVNFKLPYESRRLSTCLQSIPDRGGNCLRRRLSDWCTTDEYGEGRFAYALDNERNDIDFDKLAGTNIGFDTTDFLVENHPATEPILSYLMHIKDLLKKEGGIMSTVIEEYWLPLSYPTTAKQINESAKVGRRRDEYLILVSQSPEDATKSEYLPTLLQQTPTKIYLPNPEAEYKTAEGGGYSRFGLTPKEFVKLKQLGTLSRKFLVKQGSQSSVATLDLNGLGDYISIMAMAADDFPVLEEAKKKAGKDPDKWVPLYLELKQAIRKKNKDLITPKEIKNETQQA